MTTRNTVLLLIAGVVSALAFGCAHTGADPFVSASLTRHVGQVPACFTGPLAECVGGSGRQTSGEGLASRWRYPFHPDLHHRICRGDAQARHRFLDGVRQLGRGDEPEDMTGMYLSFLDGCSSPGFCAWALGVAGDEGESPPTRRLLFEGARRGCEDVVGEDRLTRVADGIEGVPASQPRWRTSSQEGRCAALTRADDPWADLLAVHAAGCLDLAEWLERHRRDGTGTAAALERCAQGHQIRYREADCLRELAGFDRERAVTWLRADARRGWGMSSTINRYARTLLRFPARGQLERELTRLGLLPARSKAASGRRQAAILPAEILEQQGRLARFNPTCAVRYCEHAPLLYRLADLASPELDDLIIEERWPALQRLTLGSGERAVSATVRGIPVTFRVDAAADGNSFDRRQYEQLVAGVKRALVQPHEVTMYTGGKAYRLTLRYLGEWADLEALVGGLNTILSDRGSHLRYVTLEPHCIPCAQVLAGPRDGLIEAAFAGLIEVTDPFKELWTLPNFDPGLLAGER